MRTRSSDSSSSFLSRHGVAIALAASVGLAAALRLFHLDAESIWLDEAFSVATARSTVDNILFETSEDFHPPLYFFLLYGWFHLTDGSGASARLLSVAFSLGATLATYAAGRLLVDTRTGLLAALLIAVSTFQVEYAQEARMYALLALLATLSTTALVRLSRTHGAADDTAPRRPLVSRWWLAYVGTAILLIYTHAYSVFGTRGARAGRARRASPPPARASIPRAVVHGATDGRHGVPPVALDLRGAVSDRPARVLDCRTHLGRRLRPHRSLRRLERTRVAPGASLGLWAPACVSDDATVIRAHLAGYIAVALVDRTDRAAVPAVDDLVAGVPPEVHRSHPRFRSRFSRRPGWPDSLACCADYSSSSS